MILLSSATGHSIIEVYVRGLPAVSPVVQQYLFLLIVIKNVVKIPVEIATFQNHQFRSLVRVLDHLVTTAVTTPISTEVILAVIKLLVTTIRVTAILVTAILVTAMLCQVKNNVFITRMLKCQCSTCQDSFLLVLS